MADKKISALTGASTPLAGTEVLPIVQSGATVKVAVSSLNTFAPAFSAYAGGTTSLGGATFTKVLFNTEEFDTNNNFASNTFTPTVAGYYQVTGSVAFDAPSTALAVIQKNGSAYTWGQFMTAGVNQATVTGLVFCNGSTDYIEIFAYVGVAANAIASQTQTYFQAAMIRGS